MRSTRDRVPGSASAEINRRIRRDIAYNVLYYCEHRDEIPERLQELDEEWDIERTIEANAGAVGFLGVVLSATRGRHWLVLPALVSGFLFQNAVERWCPPVPILRRLGFRTSFEIEEERQALKALRGDYAGVSKANGADEALQAARS